MTKRMIFLLWLRRFIITVILITFVGGMAYWYLQIDAANAEVAAANARLDTFVNGRAAMESAAAAGNYRAVVDRGAALQGSIALVGDEKVDVRALEGFAYFNLAGTADDETRLTDLLASRDAYEGALAALDGAEDARYASICFSLGGVYYALSDFLDETGTLQTALDYYRKNAAYTGAQDPAVTDETRDMIAYIEDRL
jgi:tetratricopeptide (TPR) repeat protein